jgi:hypothetical protein
VNNEERQLAEVLHRVTPEPPRQVTVEDIASRLAAEGGRERMGHRAPHARRGFFWRGFSRRGRGWAPALAALSVFAVAGVSAGIATVVTSHDSHAPATGNGVPPSSASSRNSSGSASSAAPSTSTGPAAAALRIAGGIWGAELINRQSFMQDSLVGSEDSLVGSEDSLYAATGSHLDRIDPATGNILRTVPYSPQFMNRPVVIGNTVWVVWSYSGDNVVLRGYNARTLAQVRSVPVPAVGGVSGMAQGVLASGPDGRLYVAAGATVAVVDPARGQLIRRIYLPADPASSVAVSPDGGMLYVGTAPAGRFRLLTYDLATGRMVASSWMSAGGAGNLVATSGGVWGTAGTGMSQWVWFALAGELTSSVRVSQGAGGGLESLPTLSGGIVWIGGSQQLACANPDTGKVRASTAIPADRGSVEYFGSLTVLSNGRAYALSQDQATQLAGLATLTPPAACSG